MLNCKKLRRQQPPHKGAAPGYVHPEEAARRRAGLFVSATRATTAFDGEGNEYTAYVLRCSYVEKGARVSWEVERRYNDFFTLHTKLKRYGTVVAELPSRNPFAKMASVMRSRENGLQVYVQAVLNHCNDKQCNYLAKFLRVQKNLPTYQEKVLAENAAVLPTAMQRHSATNVTDEDGQRGRKTASTSAATRRAKSMPRGFGKRSRHVVEGVPRSSLYARDDSSAEFSSLFKTRGQGDGHSTDGEEPSFSSWEEGRRRRQARVAEVVECGLCRTEDKDGTLVGAHARPHIGESTARQQLKILEQMRLKREQQVADSNVCIASSTNVCIPSSTSELAGIGLFFVQRQEGTCVVDEVVGGGAAESSGRINVGDVLLCVDGRAVVGLELAAIRQLIIGRPGTGVTLDFSRRLSSTRRPRFGLDDSSDEETMSGNDDVMVLRRRQREECGRDSEEMETYFVVRIIRKVQLRLHVDSDEGPSPSKHAAEDAAEDAAASPPKMMLSLPSTRAAGQGLKDTGRTALGAEDRVRDTAVAQMTVLLPHDSKAEAEGEGDAASCSSAQSLSHRSTVVANLSGHSSGDDDNASGLVVQNRASAPATPNIADKMAVASVDQVCEWLDEIELSEYQPMFRANKIDGEMLQDISEDDLMSEYFRMTNKYHRRRLLGKRATCANRAPVSTIGTDHCLGAKQQLQKV